jgi:hypothetical protein
MEFIDIPAFDPKLKPAQAISPPSQERRPSLPIR